MGATPSHEIDRRFLGVCRLRSFDLAGPAVRIASHFRCRGLFYDSLPDSRSAVAKVLELSVPRAGHSQFVTLFV